MAADERIQRADLEAKFRELETEATETAQQARSYATGVIIVAALVVATAAFVLGRRRGKKKTTIVEIRRV
jgi:hypothetical protein